MQKWGDSSTVMYMGRDCPFCHPVIKYFKPLSGTGCHEDALTSSEEEGRAVFSCILILIRKGCFCILKKNHILRLALSAMFLAIGFVLPFLTGQIPEIGSRLLPLHLPALLCGFVCGWPWGLAVGFLLPIARSLLFGMPPMIPTALAMAFEMGAYGAVAGALYGRLSGRPFGVYAALIGAMLIGRAVWGAVSWLLYALLMPHPFVIAAFWVGGFVNAWPGMALQLVLVPLIVLALQRAKLIPISND